MRYRLAAGVPVEVQGTRYYARDRHGQRWHIPESITEPIPEEPEGPQAPPPYVTGYVPRRTPNPTPPVDPVEEAWEMVREQYADDGQHCTNTLRAAVEATVAPLREQFDELCTLHARLGGRVVGLEKRIEALEANVAHHEQAIGEQAEAVSRLDEQIIDLRNRGATRAVRTVRTVAEKDAAGGEGGPSVDHVVAWLEYLGGDGPMPELRADARDFPNHAISLIREGQRDTRPVLTEEMVERAKEAYLQDPGSLANGIRAALLATGLVREADHGE